MNILETPGNMKQENPSDSKGSQIMDPKEGKRVPIRDANHTKEGTWIHPVRQDPLTVILMAEDLREDLREDRREGRLEDLTGGPDHPTINMMTTPKTSTIETSK